MGQERCTWCIVKGHTNEEQVYPPHCICDTPIRSIALHETGIKSYQSTRLLLGFECTFCTIMGRVQSRSCCSKLPCYSTCLAEKKTEMAALVTSTRCKMTYLPWKPFISAWHSDGKIPAKVLSPYHKVPLLGQRGGCRTHSTTEAIATAGLESMLAQQDINGLLYLGQRPNMCCTVWMRGWENNYCT